MRENLDREGIKGFGLVVFRGVREKGNDGGGKEDKANFLTPLLLC